MFRCDLDLFLTCGVEVLRVVFVIVEGLLPVRVVSLVGVLVVRVVIVVHVSGVAVGVAGIRVMSAPFPSAGNWNPDVEGLGI